MKKYYIYEKDIIREWVDDTHIVITDSSFQCLGYVEGVQAVYDYLKYYTVLTHPNFYAQKIVSKVLTKNDWKWLCWCYYTPRYFYIEDEYGRIRDFKELTYNAKKSKQTHKRHAQANKMHWANNHQEQRQAISPQEVKEYAFEYGIHLCTIKKKRIFDAWDNDGYFSISKSWKDQSKRKHQYKHPKKGS